MKMIITLMISLTVGPFITESSCPSVCECDATKVSCVDKGLTEIPDDIPSDTTVLDLSRNQFDVIHNDSFDGLLSLVSLTINASGVNALEEGAFNGLTALRILRLDRNNLRNVPAAVFHHLASLNEAILSNNVLDDLPPELFRNNVNLTKLDLNTNNIGILAEDTFRGLQNLRFLQLKANKLESLPVSLLNGLDQLLEVYLDANKISSLSEKTFVGLELLQILHLSTNRLRVLPETIFWQLQSLSSLTIDNNEIISLPKEIFFGMHNLKYLDMSHNLIAELHPDAFRDANSLETLDLSENELKCLSEKQFLGTQYLELLHLEGNSITLLQPTVFASLRDLRRLYLRINSLAALDERIFAGLVGLEDLYIDHNQLSSLSGNTFDGLSSLTHLELDHNPWSCDCRMRDFTAWLNNTDVAHTETGQCAYPDRHRGKDMGSVPMDDLSCYPIPIFHSPFKAVAATVGDDVTLECNVSVTANISRYWITPHMSIAFSSVGGATNCTDEGFELSEDGTLLLTSVGIEEEGAYTCIASNLEGTAAGVRVLRLQEAGRTTPPPYPSSVSSPYQTRGEGNATREIPTDYVHTTLNNPQVTNATADNISASPSTTTLTAPPRWQTRHSTSAHSDATDVRSYTTAQHTQATPGVDPAETQLNQSLWAFLGGLAAGVLTVLLVVLVVRCRQLKIIKATDSGLTDVAHSSDSGDRRETRGANRQSVHVISEETPYEQYCRHCSPHSDTADVIYEDLPDMYRLDSLSGYTPLSPESMRLDNTYASLKTHNPR